MSASTKRLLLELTEAQYNIVLVLLRRHSTGLAEILEEQAKEPPDECEFLREIDTFMAANMKTEQQDTQRVLEMLEAMYEKPSVLM